MPTIATFWCSQQQQLERKFSTDLNEMYCDGKRAKNCCTAPKVYLHAILKRSHKKTKAWCTAQQLNQVWPKGEYLSKREKAEISTNILCDWRMSTKLMHKFVGIVGHTYGLCTSHFCSLRFKDCSWFFIRNMCKGCPRVNTLQSSVSITLQIQWKVIANSLTSGNFANSTDGDGCRPHAA